MGQRSFRLVLQYFQVVVLRQANVGIPCWNVHFRTGFLVEGLAPLFLRWYIPVASFVGYGFGSMAFNGGSCCDLNC